MTTELLKLTLTNFKGIRHFSSRFGHLTNILGDNATGKTTLKDAFLWLFFGKDSTDRKDFEIKTLDPQNNPYHKLDHEVEAHIRVDDEEIVIRRTMREKWVKKRGEHDAVFTGHEVAYFWNDVPMKEGEFQAKVASVFNETVFKLITNTDYFNSLKWQNRREVLAPLAGTISNEDVFSSIITASNKGNFTPLINALNQKKTVDEFRKEIAAKKKKIKDELEQLPARIDEANRSLPEATDYDVIENSIQTTKNVLENVEDLISNKSKAQRDHQDAILLKVKEVGELRHQAQQIEFAEQQKARENKVDREKIILNKKAELRLKSDERSRLLVEYSGEERRKAGLQIIKDDLAKKWEAVNAEELKFNDLDFSCPACKRAYETHDIEAKKLELTNNFNADKSRRLQDVTERGTRHAEEIRTIEANLGNIQSKGQVLKAEIELLQNEIVILEQEHGRLSQNEDFEVKEAIAANTEYLAIQEMITLRNEEINTKLPEENNSELLARKKELVAKIDDLKRQLASKEQRERILVRIAELKDQESSMAQGLADLEGIEFSIEQFVKAKMDTLESRINGRFKLVRFKMFEDQINGGRVEACTTLINGVPYSDANTAARIQAGLDIINTLSEHYDMYGPVWVDNRESVIRLPETKSQLINLIVDEKYKKLTVVPSEEMAMA